MSAADVSWPDLTSYIPLLLDGGVAGVWIICWLKGWIVSPREVEHAEGERDAWKELYMQERESHERTRDALRLASERGEATTEALQMVAGVMNAVRTQAGAESAVEAAKSRRASRDRSSQRGHREISPPS